IANPNGPVVVWRINSSSGTYATFQTYLGFDPNTGHNANGDGVSCKRKLSDGTDPLENNVALFVQDQGVTLSTSATSVDNPENWAFFGSFGELSKFPAKSGSTRTPSGGSPTLYQSHDVGVSGGVRPSPANIAGGT